MFEFLAHDFLQTSYIEHIARSMLSSLPYYNIFLDKLTGALIYNMRSLYGVSRPLLDHSLLIACDSIILVCYKE